MLCVQKYYFREKDISFLLILIIIQSTKKTVKQSLIEMQTTGQIKEIFPNWFGTFRKSSKYFIVLFLFVGTLSLLCGQTDVNRMYIHFYFEKNG